MQAQVLQEAITTQPTLTTKNYFFELPLKKGVESTTPKTRQLHQNSNADAQFVDIFYSQTEATKQPCTLLDLFLKTSLPFLFRTPL